MAESASKSKKSEPKPDKSEAAVAEVQEDITRSIKVRDQEFPIPTQQPAEILFAARAVSRASRTGDEGAAVEAMVDMAAAYIGEGSLRDLIAGESMEEGVAIIQEVLEAASEEYGSSAGES